MSMPCGGRGWCGGCRVRFVTGAPKPSAADMAVLSQEDIDRGVRLACKALLWDDCEIVIEHGEDIYSPDDMPDGDTVNIGADGRSVQCSEAPIRAADNKEHDDDMWAAHKSPLGLAIDIGTTTIALAIADLHSGRKLTVHTAANSQRIYGSDVISRIDAAREHAVELSCLVKEDIRGLLTRAIAGSGIDPADIRMGVVAGNTTMLHLLRGYDVSGLGRYPYKAVSLEREELTLRQLIGGDLLADIPVTILPGLGAFIGADIVAGLYMIDPGDSFLFLDLGTNGEMAAGNGDIIRTTSAAAGPVFEGGGISCGCPSVPGAICHIDDKGYTTIAGAEPVGICGSGVLELTAFLLQKGIIDETGLLSKEYFDTGYHVCKRAGGDSSTPDIVFSQKDIRALQLGKAAISTGVRALALELREKDGLSLKGARIYIAGGFGSGLDMTRLSPIGLIPAEIMASAGEVRSIGNSSLGGCLQYLLDYNRDKDAAAYRLERLISRSSELELAAGHKFEELYYEAMTFGTD